MKRSNCACCWPVGNWSSAIQDKRGKLLLLCIKGENCDLSMWDLLGADSSAIVLQHMDAALLLHIWISSFITILAFQQVLQRSGHYSSIWFRFVCEKMHPKNWRTVASHWKRGHISSPAWEYLWIFKRMLFLGNFGGFFFVMDTVQLSCLVVSTSGKTNPIT